MPEPIRGDTAAAIVPTTAPAKGAFWGIAITIIVVVLLGISIGMVIWPPSVKVTKTDTSTSTSEVVPGHPLKPGEVVWINNLKEGDWTKSDNQALWFDRTTDWQIQWNGNFKTIILRDEKNPSLEVAIDGNPHGQTNGVPFKMDHPQFKVVGMITGPVNIRLLCKSNN